MKSGFPRIFLRSTNPQNLESQFAQNPIEQPPAACDTVLAACPDLFDD